jgi:hypothetical protein
MNVSTKVFEILNMDRELYSDFVFMVIMLRVYFLNWRIEKAKGGQY